MRPALADLGHEGKVRTALETPLVETLGSRPNEAYSLLSQGPDAVGDGETGGDDTSWSGFKELWSDARSVADREGFLHWEAAFPGVWRRWQEEQPVGGFDAVIGNPPWDRIKLQEVEWFSTRSPELALAPTAAARKTGIQQLRDRGAPLADEFDAAKERADKLGELIRASGNYPLLGGGDINLYSLFVERAMGLIKPDGFVGCSRRRAYTPTRRRPPSSSPFPLADEWAACSTSRTGDSEQGCRPSSPMWTPGSSSAP